MTNPGLPNFGAYVQGVVDDLAKDCHSKWLSWDHAHSHWVEMASGKAGGEDAAALHLAAYLASWGMYRASGRLFQRDYKALIPAIQFLKDKPVSDWRDVFFVQAPETMVAGNLKALADDLKNRLQRTFALPGEKEGDAPVTSTLVSKILLVTLACVPAFDSLVNAALKDLLGIGEGADHFSPAHLAKIVHWARSHSAQLEHGRSMLADGAGVAYPLTKVLDIYLWSHGAALQPATAMNGEEV